MMTDNKFIKLKAYGLLRVSGPDASKLLQGQLTCHIEKIPPEGRLAAHCNPQGRIISLFHITLIEDGYLLCLPKSMITIAAAALKKYAVFYKVNLTDVSQNYDVMLSHEPISAVAKIVITPALTLLITQPTDANEMNDEAWKQHLITEKMPAVYPETSSKFLPHELNLIALHAIDFDKGCYTGQEIIARMHYRSKIHYELYHATLSGSAFHLGDDISYQTPQGNKAIGQLVDSCHLGNDNHFALITTNKLEFKHPLFIHHEKNKVSIVNERKI